MKNVLNASESVRRTTSHPFQLTNEEEMAMNWRGQYLMLLLGCCITSCVVDYYFELALIFYCDSTPIHSISSITRLVLSLVFSL